MKQWDIETKQSNLRNLNSVFINISPPSCLKMIAFEPCYANEIPIGNDHRYAHYDLV